MDSVTYPSRYPSLFFVPEQGERLQSRAGTKAGYATLTVMLEVPHLAPVLVSYFRPQLYPAVQILSMGCMAGVSAVL